MLIIQGIYEQGAIRLLEPVPPEIMEPQEVTVTFAEPQPENSPTHPEAATSA